ncbi:hypothetical protein N9H39_08525 [Gammaproteobacteria bacterium]|nr:hypothetical protein [Gammaproteobacteria bacterium]
MAHVVKLIRVLVLTSCTALTGCVEIAAMGTVEMVENIAELGEYMTTSFDCTPPSYPDPVECVEEKHRTVDKIQVTHLVIHFPAPENDNEFVQEKVINGLNDALLGKVIIVNEKHFKKDDNYWFPSNNYKTMVFDPSPIWNIRIYEFKQKESKLIVPDKKLWSIMIHRHFPSNAQPERWELAFTILSQRLEKVITSER